MLTEVAQISGVLSDKPVEELLESLAAELPEEDKSVAFAEAAFEPVEDGGFRGVIELLLEDRSPDPGSREDSDDCNECDFGSAVHGDLLVVE